MVKQTVEQRYLVEQAIKHELKPKNKIKQALKTNEQNSILMQFNKLETALQDAHQVVRQLMVNGQTDSNLQLLDARLSTVTQIVQEIKTSTPEVIFRLSKGELQQLMQLDYQIELAKGTLNVLQQSLSK